MLSRRALGVFALAAVILAAISFAVVDVSIADASGCIGVSGPCADATMPVVATIFAIIGTLALLVSVLPAINWFAGSIHHPMHDADIDLETDTDLDPMSMARVPYEEEQL